ncbi:MAG: hypothetical protein WDN23_12865 [Edaphobacter sp.]
MSIRKEFEVSDSCGIALTSETCKDSCVRLLSGANQRLGRVFILGFTVTVCLGFSGCGSSPVKPEVGPIMATDINGVAQPAIKTLTVGSGTYLDVALTNDQSLLGADWTVSCGSALPPGTPLPPGQTIDTSCGFFTPIHTATAPVPVYAQNADGIVTYYTAPAAPPKAGTVTLYASSSADHSRFSTLTLVVAGQPISVAIVASTPPPFTLSVSGTMSLTGVLSNDYTVGGGSISWSLSCQSSDCGSLGATKTASGTAITYTAPAIGPKGNTVTVTATSVTDPTQSNSIIITIT